MRFTDSYPSLPIVQEHAIRKLPIKLQMVQLPEVEDDTRAALKAHLLNLPFSLATYGTVRIHVPKKGLTLSYNVGTSSDQADFIIDDVSDLPPPASVWPY
jgi:hypothetical protein